MADTATENWLAHRKNSLLAHAKERGIAGSARDLGFAIHNQAADNESTLPEMVNICKRAAFHGKTGFWHCQVGKPNWWWFSRSMSDVLGYGSEEAFCSDADRWMDIIHRADRAELFARLKPFLSGREHGEIRHKYRVRNKSGKWVTVRLSGGTVTEDSGRVIAVAGTQALVAEDEYLAERSLDAMKNIFVFRKWLAPDGKVRFLYANKALCNSFGVTQEQIVGKTDADLGLPKHQVVQFRVADLRVLKGQEGAFARDIVNRVQIEFEDVTGNDGKTRVFQTVKEASALPTGERCLIGVSTDVSAQVKAEKGRRLRSQLLAGVLNAFENNSIWIKDLDGKFICVNTHFAKRHSHSSSEQMYGQTDFDYWSEEDARRFQEDDRLVVDTGEVREPYKEELRWKSGAHSQLLTTKSPIKDDDGNVIAVLGMCEVLSHKEANGDLIERNSLEAKQWSLEQTRRVVLAALGGSYQSQV